MNGNQAGPGFERPGGEPLEHQRDIAQKLLSIEGQNRMLMDRVMNLNATLLAQSREMDLLRQGIQKELEKFQRGGPQRAMINVYIKLFRDLIGHMNQMEDLLLQGETDSPENGVGWKSALEVLRNHLQSILSTWGVAPIAVKEGEDLFDPEIHEAVSPMEGEVPDNVRENVIVKIRRRGWALNETILQYPQVVVG